MATIKDWKDVTLGVFKRVNEISTREDEMERAIGLVALFNHMKESEVLDMPLDDFKALLADMGWMETPPDIIMPREHYVINGKEYTLTMDFHKLSTGQYIDFQSYAKGKNAYEQMLSVFLIPKGKKYNTDYDVLEVQRDVLEMPVGEVLGLMGFFIILYRSWSAALLRYSSRMLRKDRTPEGKKMRKKLKEAADMFGFRW